MVQNNFLLPNIVPEMRGIIQVICIFQIIADVEHARDSILQKLFCIETLVSTRIVFFHFYKIFECTFNLIKDFGFEIIKLYLKIKNCLFLILVSNIYLSSQLLNFHLPLKHCLLLIREVKKICYL